VSCGRRESSPHHEHGVLASSPLDDDHEPRWESKPGLRVEGPASCPLDYRGAFEARWDSHPQVPRDPYLFRDRAPHLAGSLPRCGLLDSATSTWRHRRDSNP